MKTGPQASPKISFRPFELDTAAGTLRKHGIRIKLQPQPYKLLLLLMERAGQVVTREEIQRHVWQDSTFVDFESGINFSINQIRAALGDDAENPRYVETLPRRGYRFIAPITTAEPLANGLTHPLSHPVPAAEAAAIASPGGQASISWWNRKRLGVILLAAALLIAG